MPQMLVALDLTLSEPRQIVIAGARDASETHALVAEVHRHFVPNKVVLLADGGDGQRYLEEKLEALLGMKPVDGKAAVYVCENFTCKAVTDVTLSPRYMEPARPRAGREERPFLSTA
jgi:uncharacterized protein YyaL (SSP411 family)